MILNFIEERKIEEVVHFTTMNGLIGILDARSLRSRERISEDQRLEFILKLNSSIRRDKGWLDYVNLSISRINSEFFRSSTEWHKNITWVILSFDSSILAHEGVVFTSTNNVYHGCVLRGTGVDGLANLFLPEVEWGYYGYKKTRGSGHRPQDTTDVQAEVLYPAQVSIEYIKKYMF